MMITGKFPDHRGAQQTHHEFLKWPFFLLNYYIDSSIQGKDDPEAFAEQMNTNTLIAEIGNAISITLPKEAIMPDQYGNPLNFIMVIQNKITTEVLHPIYQKLKNAIRVSMLI